VNIQCIENFFAVHDFGATCACPENNRVALKIFTLVNILFVFRIFEQLALALKNRDPLKMLTVFNIFFTIQDF